jgi:hypothetical protein
MAAAKKKSTRSMSADHKAALAEGRDQGRKVRNYLDALESNKPKRGRRRTADSISARLARIEDELAQAEPLRRLQLAQEKIDLQHELETMDNVVDLTELENEFIEVAAAYGDRKGISYAAWREVGIKAATLRAAGIGR